MEVELAPFTLSASLHRRCHYSWSFQRARGWPPLPPQSAPQEGEPTNLKKIFNAWVSECAPAIPPVPQPMDNLVMWVDRVKRRGPRGGGARTCGDGALGQKCLGVSLDAESTLLVLSCLWFGEGNYGLNIC